MSGRTGKPADPRGDDYPRGPLLRHVSRVRAAIFLSLNLIAYAFAAAFLHYISSGEWFSKTAAGYHRSINRPLVEMLSEPLSVLSHPWMILVIGLLLTVLVVAPLLIACLYHSRFCALFLVCVAVLAHSPMLTLVLAAGCVLVAATPLRRRNPPLAVLAGLIPVGVYLYVARPSDMVLPPMQQLVMYMPLAVALVGSIVAAGLVLLIAHWVHYRPGVIWPVVTILVASPVWLFYRQVGADELAFGLLSGALTPSETVFAHESFQRESGSRSLQATLWEQQRAEEALQRRKAALAGACDDFLRRYPRSSRRPAVLWIKGVALDTQVVLRTVEEPRAIYYDEFPQTASADTWRRLVREHPTDPCAAIAHRRLAHLAGCDSRTEEMRQHLNIAAELLADIHAAVPQVRSDTPWEHLFVPYPEAPSRAYLRKVAEETDRLRWLIDRNDVGTEVFATEAFRAYLGVDRRRYARGDLYARFEKLREIYLRSPLEDNFRLEVFLHEPIRRDRVLLLVGLAEEPGSDAGIEANFVLGSLAMNMDTGGEFNRILKRPEVYFKRVQSAPANPWRRLATEHLAALTALEAATR